MASNLLAFMVGQALALPLPADSSSSHRKPIQRTISVTDESLSTVPEIHVGADWPTTLVFATPLAKDNQAVMLAQPGHEFATPRFTDTSVILIPRKDLPANGGAALTVTLTDGNIPSFNLISVPTDLDLRADAQLKLTTPPPPHS